MDGRVTTPHAAVGGAPRTRARADAAAVRARVRPSAPPSQVNDADFQYAPHLPHLFKDLNFGVDQQSRVCIVGNNGAGKSTLLNMITGKLKPTTGEIKFNPR